jgi:hypothetical protein
VSEPPAIGKTIFNKTLKKIVLSKNIVKQCKIIVGPIFCPFKSHLPKIRKRKLKYC